MPVLDDPGTLVSAIKPYQVNEMIVVKEWFGKEQYALLRPTGTLAKFCEAHGIPLYKLSDRQGTILRGEVEAAFFAEFPQE